MIILRKSVISVPGYKMPEEKINIWQYNNTRIDILPLKSFKRDSFLRVSGFSFWNLNRMSHGYHTSQMGEGALKLASSFLRHLSRAEWIPTDVRPSTSRGPIHGLSVVAPQLRHQNGTYFSLPHILCIPTPFYFPKTPSLRQISLVRQIAVRVFCTRDCFWGPSVVLHAYFPDLRRLILASAKWQTPEWRGSSVFRWQLLVSGSSPLPVIPRSEQLFGKISGTYAHCAWTFI